MKMRTLLLFAALIASARADLTMSLTPAVQNSARGREIVFSGTLTNTSGSAKLYLNDIAAIVNTGPATELPLKTNSFFWNVPGVLLPGESYTNSELFRVALKTTAPASDYRGVVTIRGGGDMTGNGDLAAANFAVLSPAVQVQATDSSAGEFGPDLGSLQITRTGGTDVELSVALTASGTAASGVDYLALPSLVTIPAGSSSASLIVTPIPNNIAQGERTAQLTVASSPAYNLGAPTNASVIIHDKPADAWRFANFGENANDLAAADSADWDRDGIVNLLEFALGSDPKNGGSESLPSVNRSGGYLTLTFVPNTAASDVTFLVEGSSDLVTWSTSAAEFVSIGNPLNQLTYRYPHAISGVDAGFLRLRVTRLQP